MDNSELVKRKGGVYNKVIELHQVIGNYMIKNKIILVIGTLVSTKKN